MSKSRNSGLIDGWTSWKIELISRICQHGVCNVYLATFLFYLWGKFD